MKYLFLSLMALGLTACATISGNHTATQLSDNPVNTEHQHHESARTLILGNEEYTSGVNFGFFSWKCRDYSDAERVLVEFGFIKFSENYRKSNVYKNMNDTEKEALDETLKLLGFILYDGTNTGEITSYTHAGLNHRWDWSSMQGRYSFIVKPNGTGLFYDFSTAKNGVKDRADDVYKCNRHWSS